MEGVSDDAGFASPVAASSAWESSARSYAGRFPRVFVAAQGPWLIDQDGRRFLDFLGGAGVLLLGHNHPDVQAALAAQARPVGNSLDLLTDAKLSFVETLHGVLPGDLARTHKIHFCGPTGSDAVEAALKLAARATGRRGVIAFHGGYHGMGQGALAVSSSRRLREAGLLMAGQVAFCPYPYPLRFPEPFRTPEAAAGFCLAQLRLMIEDDHAGQELPGLVLLEAVQGEGGTIVPPPGFLREVEALCRRHGILLGLDEIQSGLGRAGRWFAYEDDGIQPDLICVSKGIGGGYPLSLLLFDRRLDVWRPGDHIGTFRGQSIALVAGKATLEVIARDALPDNAARVGARLKEDLARRTAGHPKIREVRGLGLMLGIETDSGATADALQAALFQAGVIVETGGREGAVLRLLPPLTIGAAEVEACLEAFAGALECVS
ncbi:aspartate aminotransferase family protein [Pararhodospirillum oryzae]|uniref:Diaminobutyrate--2-oxoglutarate transaminase n=1 Tax=Pararhodospirillum oryzae TaxID=478448 RepID=A0A512H754_9PROT|nr:aspartate aminotransferase family protein [Pararhodospirillum oryzae]GEO81286.1 hypothetical protein ROR02_14170 [Pararhodospirillum oryzae]